MKLTTKGRFAVTAMIDLALRQADGPVALASISERQKISLSYLEQLFGKLRRCGLVSSVRGPGGGYCMAKPTTAVFVADIIRAVDEPIDVTMCSGNANCQDDEPCMTHQLWTSLTNRMLDYLSSVSLAELVEQQRSRIGTATLMKERELRAQSRRPRRTIAVAAA